MKIFTQSFRNSAMSEFRENFHKTLLLVLFISLAITALADSVLLFSDLSSTTPYFYECKISRTSSLTLEGLY